VDHALHYESACFGFPVRSPAWNCLNEGAAPGGKSLRWFQLVMTRPNRASWQVPARLPDGRVGAPNRMRPSASHLISEYPTRLHFAPPLSRAVAGKRREISHAAKLASIPMTLAEHVDEDGWDGGISASFAPGSALPSLLRALPFQGERTAA
jgi:hypothetical protein